MPSSLLHDAQAQLDYFGSLNGAGWSCIDFVNTVNGRGQGEPDDTLRDYVTLLAWAEHASILARGKLDGLAQEAGSREGEATEVMLRARALREAIFTLFVSTVEEVDVQNREQALDLLNQELAQAMSHIRLVSEERDFDWRWEFDQIRLDTPLWPIARSAADLLTSDLVIRVGCCASDDCGWLFFDTSRNRSRRWCDMASCGNRAKATRYYRRQQQ